MSHIVQIVTQVKDAVAVAAACHRLGLAEPVRGTAQMYAGQTAEGLLVQLPGWKYPIAINTVTGEIKHDNFSDYWGESAELDRFIQMYAVERARIEARRQGHQVSEQLLTDGSIKLTIQTG